jgi:type II secretory pathway pseudopilin PulG
MAGFTVIELLISMAMTLAVMAAALSLAQPAQAAFRVQLEAIDLNQRLRAAADALTRDLLMAGSGLAPGVAAVAPYQPGSVETGLTIRHASSAEAPVIAHSYYVRREAGENVYELRRLSGATDVPVVDHIATAAFTCFDDGGAVVPLCDDVARIRRIRIVLQAQAVMRHMRTAPTLLRIQDEQAVVDVAPRALTRVE